MTDWQSDWVSPDAMVETLNQHFEGWQDVGQLIEVDYKAATTRLVPQPMHLRLGNTVSGPAMFAMADVCMYLAIIWTLGSEAAASVTADMHSRFLRRPPGDQPLICKARLIRVGRNLIVAEAMAHAEGDEEPLALFTASYSNPTGVKV